MSANVLSQIEGRSNFAAVNISLAMNPMNYNDEIRIFNCSLSDYRCSGIFDTRLGGFGILFFESIIICVFGLFLMYNNRNRKYAIIIGVIFYLALFILPSGWWARYVAFFYLVPIIMAIVLIKEVMRARILGYLAISFLLIDIMCSSKMVFNLASHHKQNVETILSNIQTIESPIEIETQNAQFLDKLKRQGVEFSFNPSLEEDFYLYELMPGNVKISKNVAKNCNKNCLMNEN